MNDHPIFLHPKHAAYAIGTGLLAPERIALTKPIPMKSDTPKTDAELLEICEGNQCFGYVRIGFARKLECENRRMREALEHITRWTNDGELLERARNALKEAK